MEAAKKQGVLYWRDCSPPFQKALERQYNRLQQVDSFTMEESPGTKVTWTHNLRQMVQTNQSSSSVKPVRRVRISPPVPPQLDDDDDSMTWAANLFQLAGHGVFLPKSDSLNSRPYTHQTTDRANNNRIKKRIFIYIYIYIYILINFLLFSFVYFFLNVFRNEIVFFIISLNLQRRLLN